MAEQLQLGNFNAMVLTLNIDLDYSGKLVTVKLPI